MVAQTLAVDLAEQPLRVLVMSLTLAAKAATFTTPAGNIPMAELAAAELRARSAMGAQPANTTWILTKAAAVAAEMAAALLVAKFQQAAQELVEKTTAAPARELVELRDLNLAALVVTAEAVAAATQLEITTEPTVALVELVRISQALSAAVVVVAEEVVVTSTTAAPMAAAQARATTAEAVVAAAELPLEQQMAVAVTVPQASSLLDITNSNYKFLEICCQSSAMPFQNLRRVAM